MSQRIFLLDIFAFYLTLYFETICVIKFNLQFTFKFRYVENISNFNLCYFSQKQHLKILKKYAMFKIFLNTKGGIELYILLF